MKTAVGGLWTNLQNPEEQNQRARLHRRARKPLPVPSPQCSTTWGQEDCTAITPASPLDEDTPPEVKIVLKSFLAKGPVLKLEVKIDPSVMGGMIVPIEEKYVEMSVNTKIQKVNGAVREIFQKC